MSITLLETKEVRYRSRHFVVQFSYFQFGFCDLLTAPIPINIGIVGTGSVNQGERQFFQFPFPLDGLTIGISVTSGSVVCYSSDQIQNPTSTQGYDWRIETDGYADVYIDPDLLNRNPGQYIYAAIEGLESGSNFSLNSTVADRRGWILAHITLRSTVVVL